MSKIVYLFGAGASKNALPLVKDIPVRMEELLKRLKLPEYVLTDEFFDDTPIEQNMKTKKQYQQEMINSFEWLLTESKRHASIDTFAKKIFLIKDDDKLKKLKIALSVFFVCEQSINPPDSRYDSFFASILNKSPLDLPENIKIVSWNYDYQFELAFSEYIRSTNLSHNQSELRVKAKYSNTIITTHEFIYKLNGTTSIIADGFNQYNFIDDFISFDRKFIENITYRYAAAIDNKSDFSTLSFSWEKENLEPNIVDTTIANTKDADAVVVIGYSFPFFNRDVDRKIFDSMTNLKKVYFQAPDAENLRERFEAIKSNIEGIELILKKDTEQFFLPNEL